MLLVRTKLPESIQMDWQGTGTEFEIKHNSLPAFSDLCDFIQKTVTKITNKNFECTLNQPQSIHPSQHARTLATDVYASNSRLDSNGKNALRCAFDDGNHTLAECERFRKAESWKRRSFAKNKRLCFRCLNVNHEVWYCDSESLCSHCGSFKHHSMLHDPKLRPSGTKPPSKSSYDSTPDNCTPEPTPAKVKATNASVHFESDFSGKSCGKTILVHVTSPGTSTNSIKMYAIVDDQSTHTFVDPQVFKMLNVKTVPRSVLLITLDKLQTVKEEEQGEGLVVRGITESKSYALPSVLSCSHIPNTTADVATPDIVRSTHGIQQYAGQFSNVDPEAKVLMLIGRDASELLRSEFFGNSPPFAVKTPLGWCVVGIVLDTAYDDGDDNDTISGESHVALTRIDNHQSMHFTAKNLPVKCTSTKKVRILTRKPG